MTHEGSDGLVVDAEVRRGDFMLAVSLAAAPGQVVGMLGPNGGGKSTLLSAVAGLTPVSARRVTLAGQVMDDASTGACRVLRTADRFRLPELPALPPIWTVAEERLASHREREARGSGLPGQRRATGSTGSTSATLPTASPASCQADRRKRWPWPGAGWPASIAAPGRTPVGLDAGTRLDVQTELKRHLADFTGPCLLVTHDPLEALVLADQLIVLEGGHIVQEGTPARIARQPATDYVAKLVGLNLYAGRADGATVTLTGGGTFVVPDQGQHGDVLVAVRPSAIVVSSQRPQPSSARNTWQAKVTGLTLLADRVRLDLDGQPSALVDVTPAAVAELSLEPGRHVWLTVKATDLEVYTHADRQAD